MALDVARVVTGRESAEGRAAAEGEAALAAAAGPIEARAPVAPSDRDADVRRGAGRASLFEIEAIAGSDFELDGADADADTDAARSAAFLAAASASALARAARACAKAVAGPTGVAATAGADRVVTGEPVEPAGDASGAAAPTEG